MVVIRPKRAPEVVEIEVKIENDFSAMQVTQAIQAVVDVYLERVPVGDLDILVVNNEGQLIGLPFLRRRGSSFGGHKSRLGSLGPLHVIGA